MFNVSYTCQQGSKKFVLHRAEQSKGPPQQEIFLGFYTLLSSPGSTGYQDLAAGFWWTQQSSVHHRDPRTYSTGYQDLVAGFWWTQQSYVHHRDSRTCQMFCYIINLKYNINKQVHDA